MPNDVCHIAVLEDNLPDLIMIEKSIRDTGLYCEITTFSDGAQALAYVDAATSRIPDLIILDYNVPKIEGASVLTSIRANMRWNAVGVFMFTASQDPRDMARVKMLGADEYLKKPMDLAGFSKFGEFVKDWLTERRNQLKREAAN